ncbi:hypothetical protein CLROS_028990 [Clostridium felsineum]|uniref:Uncharacterized protein n=1 Tax=Clostridium felsineum TaxID=36839 RepID=A0A1S8L3D1_9CLOT|nr:hypothetical protein CLROS_028990 [Clostridium felsineum]URZ12591.1 hypothetical protein CROST_033140 [Clostridium felsineum]
MEITYFKRKCTQVKIILTREGIEKSKQNTGCIFNDEPAVKFLAEIFEKIKKEENLKVSVSEC